MVINRKNTIFTAFSAVLVAGLLFTSSAQTGVFGFMLERMQNSNGARIVNFFQKNKVVTYGLAACFLCSALYDFNLRYGYLMRKYLENNDPLQQNNNALILGPELQPLDLNEETYLSNLITQRKYQEEKDKVVVLFEQ